MALTYLLGDRLAPVTYSIGFLSAPPERVVRAARWLYFRWPDAWRRVAVLDGGLEKALLQLQPLGGFLLPRVLVASTALEGWSAVFDGDARGQGVKWLSVRLARALRVPGYFVASALVAHRFAWVIHCERFSQPHPLVDDGIWHGLDIPSR